MLVARIVAVLLVVCLGATFTTFMVTKDHRWLRYTGQVLRLGIFILLIIITLYVIERFFVLV